MTCDPALCVFGVCTNASTALNTTTTSLSYCECHQGWTYDNTLIHNGKLNCGLPDTALLAALVVSFVVLTLCVVWLALAWKQAQGKKTNDMIVGSALIVCVALMIQCVGLYVQDGFFEIGIVFTCLAVFWTAIWSHVVLSTIADWEFVGHEELAKRTKRDFGFVTLGLILLWITSAIALVVNARESDVGFNIIMCYTYFAMGIIGTGYGVVFYWRVSQVLVILASNSNTNIERGAAVSKHLVSFRRSLIMFFGGIGPSCCVLPVVYLSFGDQFPFVWVFGVVFIQSFMLSLTYATWIMVRPRTTTSSTSNSSRRVVMQASMFDNNKSNGGLDPTARLRSVIVAAAKSNAEFPVSKMTSFAARPRTVNQMSIFEDESSKILLRRQGAENLDFPDDKFADDAQQADIFIDKNEVSILTEHTLLLSEADTIIGKVGDAPKAREFLATFASSQMWAASNVLGSIIIYTLQVCALLGVLTPWVSLIQVPPLILSLVAIAFVVSLRVLKRLTVQPFVAFRMFFILGGAAAMHTVLLDARAVLIPNLVIAQLLSYGGDSFTSFASDRVRVFIVFATFVTTATLFVLMQLGLVAQANQIYVTFVGLNGGIVSFSIYQSARDCHLANSLLLLGELYALWRGTHKRRFLHIHSPVAFVEVSFDSINDRHSVSHFVPGASQVGIESGFLVPANDVARVVYVDTLAIRQSDAIACHILGNDLGRRVVETLRDVTWVKIFLMCLQMGGLACTMILASSTLPFDLVSTLCLSICVPAVTLNVLHRWPRKSWHVVRLVLLRNSARVHFVLAVVWFAITAVLLNGDARCVVLVWMMSGVFDLITRDADVASSSKQYSGLSRFAPFSLHSVALFLFPLIMFVAPIPGAWHPLIDTRPDLTLELYNGTVSENSPWVVDVYQASIDFGMGLVVQHVLTSMWTLVPSRRDKLATIEGPVVPISQQPVSEKSDDHIHF